MPKRIQGKVSESHRYGEICRPVLDACPSRPVFVFCRSPAAKLLLAGLLCAGGATGCIEDKVIEKRFVDNFDRAEIGEAYSNTGGPYRIVKGELRVKGAYNKPLWLRRRLPENARIEFDVVSHTKDGDIKVEAWGDGSSFATSKGAYLATSYVFVFGGWNNSVSILARMDEHDPNRPARKDLKVEKERRYHWKIERKSGRVTWFIDGKTFLEMNDKAPLSGSRHAYFGFNNWQSDVAFDNLSIEPL